jgi:hypothetical protein
MKTEEICTLNSADLEEQQGGAPILPPEIRHVPLWVKGIVAAGLILFAMQLPNFKGSLVDVIRKNRALDADKAGQFPDAVKLYEELHSRYPNDNELIKKLAYSQYHAGQFASALKTFDLLVGVDLSKNEIEKINVVVSDIESKLKGNN